MGVVPVCCVLLFEIRGVSNAKAVRFRFCVYVQIRIAWHVRASSPAVHPCIPLKQSIFSTGCADWIARSKNWDREGTFSNCVRMHDLVFDRKSPFSIHRSDCIRIGLRMSRSFLQDLSSGAVPASPGAQLQENIVSTFSIQLDQIRLQSSVG